ncbi:uncharacterized protein Eint_081010 [Encephalitozoon intestinalis ATCC 50506]|uniref:Uncharacterized protein n=1 Tax=Encephalitozoon intestinalis (strain ATCC 50506) TaxID=876142 RepID=E0S8Q0_ENCIT|nr:uncharacterized protein Eint_081010 [Encephalitozoon intestinalis ATCC 50506]ADM12033.2 hypothetical protein Eint_081010 [Encephalitozoon intestinalis ATCC 50506]UTX45821.1 Spc7 kinetochore protein [Encephalitozoon intestinalis]
MGEEKDTKKKRVSFAPEPQVMYIYPEEENKSNKAVDSGMMSEDEISVELTVDHLRGRKTEDGGDGEFLNAELKDLMEDSEVGYGAMGDNSGKEDEVEKEKCKENYGVEEGEIKEVKDDEECKEGGAENSETGWREGPCRNEQEEFEDTLMSNETVNVEEIINTQDLRKIIPQVRKEMVNVSELLVSKGIRFLDSLVVSNTRRDTMSKSRNEVHPRQERFYESFLEPRTRFFLEFSSDLEDRMLRQEKVNEELEREFRIAGTVFESPDASSLLRALKTECRMKSKIEWYELRKEKEVEFNREVTDRRNRLAEEYNHLGGCLKETSEKVEESKRRNEEMEEQIRRIKNRLGMDGDGRHQKISELRALMSKQEGTIESGRKEVKRLEEERTRKQAERRVLKEALEKMEMEIRDLEEVLKTQNITEGDVKEIRQEFRTLCAAFGMELMKVDTSEVRLRILEYNLKINLGAGFVIESIEATPLCDRKDLGHLYHHFGKYFEGKGCSFFKGIRDAMFMSAMVSGLCKELSGIKKRHSVECSGEDNEAIVRILALDVEKCTKHEISIKIKNGFECLIQWKDRSQMWDLKKDVGIISRSVEEALANR